MERLRRAAWLLILIADVGLLAWGAMAALAPEHLLGPGHAPILAAGYEGFTKWPWPVGGVTEVSAHALPGVRQASAESTRALTLVLSSASAQRVARGVTSASTSLSTHLIASTIIVCISGLSQLASTWPSVE